MAINNLQDLQDILSSNNIDLSDSSMEHLLNDYNAVMNSNISSIDDKTVVMEHLTTEILMDDTLADKMDEVDHEDRYVDGYDNSGAIEEERYAIEDYSYELRSVSNAIENFVEEGTGSVSNGPVDILLTATEDGKYTVEISAEEELEELDSVKEFDSADEAIAEFISAYEDAEGVSMLPYDLIAADTFDEGFEEKASNVISALNESLSESEVDKIENSEQKNSDDENANTDVLSAFDSPIDFGEIIKSAIDDYKEQTAQEDHDTANDERNDDFEQNLETFMYNDTEQNEADTDDWDDTSEDDLDEDDTEDDFWDSWDSVD